MGGALGWEGRRFLEQQRCLGDQQSGPHHYGDEAWREKLVKCLREALQRKETAPGPFAPTEVFAKGTQFHGRNVRGVAERRGTPAWPTAGIGIHDGLPWFRRQFRESAARLQNLPARCPSSVR